MAFITEHIWLIPHDRQKGIIESTDRPQGMLLSLRIDGHEQPGLIIGCYCDQLVVHDAISLLEYCQAMVLSFLLALGYICIQQIKITFLICQGKCTGDMTGTNTSREVTAFINVKIGYGASPIA